MVAKSASEFTCPLLFNSLKTEREREREKKESRGGRERPQLEGRGKIFFSSGFEGSQAVPARPSGGDMFERE
jgi:hypothetical protein